MFESYLITIAILTVIIDSIFIYFIMKPFWNDTVLKIQGFPLRINIYYGLFAYILLVFGIYYFVFKDDNIIMNAIIFGLIVYGVFDCTVGALFTNYPIWLAITDMIWGMILITIVSYITYKIHKIENKI